MLSRSCAVMVLGAALCAAGQRADAQTATQVVRFRVQPASQAAVEPVKTPLSMRDAKSTEAETRYAIGSTAPNRKLLASLDHALPGGVSLSVVLTPPTGATTSGSLVLDTIATDLLTSIPVSSETGLPVRYTLSTDAAPARLSAEEREVTVTYTVVEQP